MLSHIVLITTGGNRERELQTLFASIPDSERVLVAILTQGCTLNAPSERKFKLIHLSEGQRVSLSHARNKLLEHINREIKVNQIASDTRLIFADDDCWYSTSFFHATINQSASNAIYIHPAFDPENNRAFAVKDVRKIPSGSKLDKNKLLFCATSIGLDIPAFEGLQLRFNENIGLGCDVSQGEETLYLFHFLRRHPNTAVLTLAEGPVFHPHKIAINSRNHYSLAYFLGWCGKDEFPFTSRYFIYKLIRSFSAIFFRPSVLSVNIFVDLVKGYYDGCRDSKKLGSPLSPNF